MPSDLGPAALPAPSLGELLAAWCAEALLAGSSPRTLRAYREHVEATFASLDLTLRDTPALTEVWTRTALTRALLSYRDRPDRRHGDLAEAPSRRSPSSVRLRLQGLRNFSRWLEGAGHIVRDPVGDLRLPPVTPPALPTRRALTALEVADLAAAARASRSPERDLLLLAFLAGLGCTLGETLALRLADVDLALGTLHVRSRTPRTLSLTPWLRAALEAYLPIRSGFLAPSVSPGADPSFLFVLSSADPRVRARTCARALTRLATRAGLEPHLVTSHALRASFAQFALDAGVSVPALLALLGLRSLAALRQMLVLPAPPALALAGHPLAAPPAGF